MRSLIFGDTQNPSNEIRTAMAEATKNQYNLGRQSNWPLLQQQRAMMTAEASGRIIRFEVPTNRQAYDSDLRSFRAKLRVSLEEMEAPLLLPIRVQRQIFWDQLRWRTRNLNLVPALPKTRS